MAGIVVYRSADPYCATLWRGKMIDGAINDYHQTIENASWVEVPFCRNASCDREGQLFEPRFIFGAEIRIRIDVHRGRALS